MVRNGKLWPGPSRPCREVERSRIINQKSEIINKKAQPLGLFEEEIELLMPRQRPDMVAWAQAHYVLPTGDVEATQKRHRKMQRLQQAMTIANNVRSRVR